MEKELFMNTGLPPHPPPPGMAMRFEPPSPSPAMMNWSSMSSSMEIQPPELNLVQNPTQDCFFWEKSTEQNTFDSALSSLVSSPTASNSNFSGGGEGGDSFLIRELIGKLGNIGNNSGEIFGTPANNASCYATPMSSPQPRSKLSSPIFVAKTTPLAEFSGDPGFAERAARFSCFGSRSFNGRTNSPFSMNNGAAGSNNIENGSAATVGPNGKLPRVSSSPALKALASHMCKNPPGSEVQCPKVSGELSRKRKSVPKAKPKECSASPSPNFLKGGEGNEESGGKRCKNSEENGKKEEKREEERKGNDTTNKTKPPEPPKDYIHVRARRGQATDSHSLAERVRREKISERMKLLQDLVPGCNKVTGKALMLDEIINYVQSLQRQVEFLSMKLASVNTRLEFNVDALVSKDMIPQSSERVIQLDSTAQSFLRNHHQKNNLQLHPNISSNSTMPQCPIDHLDTSTLTRSFISHMPPPPILNQLSDSIPQYSTFCEDDLHSLIQMGFAQYSESQSESIQIQPQNFQSSNQASNTKIDL